MSRGIVMETGSKHVIVLTPDGQFRRVRTALKPQIGEEFTFSEQRRMQRPRKLYSFSVGAAAIALLLFAPLLMQHFSKKPDVVAYLTMDVNPSIELGINKDEQVEVLRAINADGADVTEGLDFKGLPLQQVTEAIMDRISAGPYLNSGEGDVVITSIAIGDSVDPAGEIDLTSHMDEAVRKSLAKTEKGRQLKIEVTTLSAPQEVREEAKKEGLSSGKLAFYLMAKEHGYHVTIKELKQESLHQAAKPMGGVAAVMNDDDDDGAKDEGGSTPGSATKQQPVDKPQPSKPDSSKEAEKEALREKQKKQLQELLQKEQEKRKEHQEKTEQGQKGHGPKDDGSENDSAKNGGPKNGNAKNGSNPAKANDRKDGLINIGGNEHSPGNNAGSGGSSPPKQTARGRTVEAPSNEQANSNSKDNGKDKGKGGNDEAKNASDGRHSGVQAGNTDSKGKTENSPGSNWDKDVSRGNDDGNDDDRGKKDNEVKRDDGSGDNGNKRSDDRKGR